MVEGGERVKAAEFEACDLLATRDDAVRSDRGSCRSSAKVRETIRDDLSVREVRFNALAREGEHGRG